MQTLRTAALAFILSLGILNAAHAGGARDALIAGAQIMAVTALPDGRFAITFQKGSTATICIMQRPNTGAVETDNCYTVR